MDVKELVTVVPAAGESDASAVIMTAEAGADALNVMTTATRDVDWPGTS